MGDADELGCYGRSRFFGQVYLSPFTHTIEKNVFFYLSRVRRLLWSALYKKSCRVLIWAGKCAETKLLVIWYFSSSRPSLSLLALLYSKSDTRQPIFYAVQRSSLYIY